MVASEFNAAGSPAFHPGGVRITRSRFMLQTLELGVESCWFEEA